MYTDNRRIKRRHYSVINRGFTLAIGDRYNTDDILACTNNGQYKSVNIMRFRPSHNERKQTIIIIIILRSVYGEQSVIYLCHTSRFRPNIAQNRYLRQ